MAFRRDNRPVIVKRRRVHASHPHHSGAWKIAYADFVTAMMAFFLLMWLLNATTEDQRKGLADYFSPSIPISSVSAGGAGMLQGKKMLDKPDAAGSVPQGVQPRPSHRAEGPPLGTEDAAQRSVKTVPEANVGGAPDKPDTAAADAATTAPGTADGKRPDGPFPDKVAAERPSPASARRNRGFHDGVSRDTTAPDTARRDETARQATERAKLEHMARRIEAATRERGGLSRHFFLHVTPEGLVIEIVDANDRPLFPVASARPAPILEALMDVLVPVLEEVTNDIAVVGHTDSTQFGGQGYSNWELSADRANAARRLMLRRGLPESRVARVTGKAAVDPLVPDTTAPQNRRIAVTLLRNPAGGTR